MKRHAGFALVLCGLLAGGCFLPNFGAFGNEEMPLPTVLATYTTGFARLQVFTSNEEGGTGEELILDHVGRGSTLNNFMGAAVNWRNNAGWVLQVSVYDYDSLFAPPASGSPADETYAGDVTVQRITGNEFWAARSTGAFGNRCIVDIEESSETLVRGSATCQGLRWEDGTAPEPLGDPVYIEGHEPFNVEVTFEATP